MRKVVVGFRTALGIALDLLWGFHLQAENMRKVVVGFGAALGIALDLLWGFHLQAEKMRKVVVGFGTFPDRNAYFSREIKLIGGSRKAFHRKIYNYLPHKIMMFLKAFPEKRKTYIPEA